MLRTSLSLDHALASELASLRERGLHRRLREIIHRDGAIVDTPDGARVDFSSNDYLGLATDPRLAAAAAECTRSLGTGGTASRLIAGNTAVHDALDADLAAWFGVEAALSFATGYAANTGVIPALVTRGDAIFAEQLNHASLIDGCRLSRADVHVYPHGDLGALASLLATHRATYRRAMIVTDGMFSMDGDLAPLREIVALAREHDAWTYVDDAHAMGVLGNGGRGSTELLGVTQGIDVIVGTLGKAFGSAGAFALGSHTLRDVLINRARSFVFSTAPMPMQAAAAREALRIARAEPERRVRVRAVARHLRERLRARGLHVPGSDDAHIIPVLVGDAVRTLALGARLEAQGFLAGAVRPPTVPDGTSRLRITVSASHTTAQIDALADAVAALLPGNGTAAALTA
ncbi:MAG: 8-amino-7-oxononanoate synthase [Gemmatimonadaceae bacterium]|nr:8-amino-7-oxononanoate synthase [Gemmatimonadaceae bacterium]